MPFNGGIGLHDASWRGSFGGTIYKNGGSHGCINLPYSKAQAIYNIITKDIADHMFLYRTVFIKIGTECKEPVLIMRTGF